MCMRHLELHVITERVDALKLAASGIDVDVDSADCAACADAVGAYDNEFYEFAVVLDGESQWYVCTDCASDVLDPTFDL